MGRARSGTCAPSRRPHQRTGWSWREPCGSRVIWERGFWPKRTSGFAVPLSKIQSDILRVLASQRDPESYVAGATPLNRDAVRYSGDIDIFHDREERVVSAALADAQTLGAAGFNFRWLRQFP